MSISEIKQPHELNDEKKDEFVDFVYRHGHIPNRDNIVRGVKNAKLLLLEYGERGLVGTAAIKCPSAGHTERTFKEAGSASDAEPFLLDLGYVATDPKCLRQGIGSRLVKLGLDKLNGHPIYATIRADNGKVFGLLDKFQFVREGENYRSTEGLYDVTLFVRQ